MIRLAASKRETVRWIAFQDEAVGCSKEEYLRYLDTGDEGLLQLSKEAQVFMLRTPSSFDRDASEHEGLGPWIPGGYIAPTVAFALVRRCLEDLTPWPEEQLGKKESGWMFDTNEARRKFRPDLLALFPGPVIVDCAAYLDRLLYPTADATAELKKK